MRNGDHICLQHAAKKEGRRSFVLATPRVRYLGAGDWIVHAWLWSSCRGGLGRHVSWQWSSKLGDSQHLPMKEEVTTACSNRVLELFSLHFSFEKGRPVVESTTVLS